MRLLNTRTLQLELFMGENMPKYAILSHTWGPDAEEVTFKDLVDGTGEVKASYKKIRFCADSGFEG